MSAIPTPRDQQATPRPPQGQMASPPVLPSGFFGQIMGLWDIDTADVKTRCVLALNPLLKQPFLVNGGVDVVPGTIAYGKLPDMWGPVWILHTVVLAMFMSAAIAGMIFQFGAGQRYEYSVGILTSAAALMSVFTFGVPLAVWLAVQFFNLVPDLTLAQTICLYGYSNVIWVPVVVISGSPLAAPPLVGSVIATIVRWGATLVGFAMSAWFIYGNLFRVTFQHASDAVSVDRTKGLVILGAGILLHAILALAVQGTFSASVSYK